MGTLTAVEETLYLLSSSVKQSLADWCDISSVFHDQQTFSTSNGGLLNVWQQYGALRLLGDAEMEALLAHSQLALQTPLRQSWHALQAVFIRDPECTEEHINAQLQPLSQNMQRLGLDLSDILAARLRKLSETCVFEESYLSAWTQPTLLSRPERRRADKERLRQHRQASPVVEAQPLDQVYSDLLEAHLALCHVLTHELSAAGLFVEPLEAHAALRAIRQCIEPKRTALDWRPALPGEPLPLRIPDRVTQDISDLLWPPIGQQLFANDGERVGNDSAMIKIGERLYSSVYLEQPPLYVQPFNQLFERLDVNLPWRISFRLEGDGFSGLNIKRFLAAIMAFTHPQNRLIVDAVNELEQQIRAGQTACKLRIAATTWSPAGQEELLRIRRQRLAKALESWGTCQVRLETGDAAQGMVCTLPALYNHSIGVAAASPVNDVVKLLPLTRPASPWTTGSVLFRTADHKLWPFQPGSAVQPGWVEVYLGPPGYGKSVLMHLINQAFIVTSERELPYLGGIDIGGSSEGLVDMVREALPEKQRHQVLYQRLQQTPLNAINHFDTQLGCRQPLAFERAALANFLTLLGTPIERSQAEEGTAELSLMVIDDVYKQLRDDEHGHPKRYAKTVSPEVDQALSQLDVQLQPDNSWWQVVDCLFEAGDMANAIRAQRYAVPSLEDAVHVLTTTEAIKEMWGEKLTSTGESLIKSLSRQWRSAARQFPLLARPTALDLGNARIVFLDLEEVASRGGQVSERETAVMYMLARYVIANDFFLHPEHVAEFPAQYQDYHRQRIQIIRETPKRLCYDEYHRVRHGGDATHVQIKTDTRECRKRDIQLAISTQRFQDCDDELLDMTTCRFILGFSTEKSLRDAAATFGFTDSEQWILRHRLTAPTAAGAPLLFQFETQRGRFSQYLLATIGAEELWGLSTVSEDAAIRRRVKQVLGSHAARAALAHYFPSGSAKQAVEQRKRELQQQSISQEQHTLIFDELAEQVITAYRQNSA